MPAALQFQHTAPSGLENGTLLVTMVMEGFMGRCLLIFTKLEFILQNKVKITYLMIQGEELCALHAYRGHSDSTFRWLVGHCHLGWHQRRIRFVSVLCGSEAQHMHLGERSSVLREEGDRAASGPVQNCEGVNPLGNTYRNNLVCWSPGRQILPWYNGVGLLRELPEQARRTKAIIK